MPAGEDELLTSSGGQVRGLSGEAVQRILLDYGISRVLAKEGGRTSRGSLENMRLYLAFIQSVPPSELSFEVVERFWVEQAKAFFAQTPLTLRLEQGSSVDSALDSLLAEASARQAEGTGMMIVGAVVQHLVGAKLKFLYPDQEIPNHGSSVADEQSSRDGDFLVSDCAVHVSTNPSEALIRRCAENIAGGLNPLIISLGNGVVAAQNHAGAVGLEKKIEILEWKQFLVANVFEHSRFSSRNRKVAFEKIISLYNEIVEQVETDPGLLRSECREIRFT